MQFDLLAQLDIHVSTFRIKENSLFWVVPSAQIKFEYEATIDARCDQTLWFLKEVDKVDQSDSQFQRFEEVEMFVEDQEEEVSGDCKVQV